MEKLYKISKSDLMARQWCFQHQSYCHLFGASAETELDIAGLPCWDMSLAGKRAAEEGPTATVFMSHAKLHKQRKTPILILENVKAGCGEDFIRVRNKHSQDRSFLTFFLTISRIASECHPARKMHDYHAWSTFPTNVTSPRNKALLRVY